MSLEFTPAVTGRRRYLLELREAGFPARRVRQESEAEEFAVPHHFYLPRGGDSRSTQNGLPRPPSCWRLREHGQPAGLLPVTVLAPYIGLGNGLSNWTFPELLPQDATLLLGNKRAKEK